MVLFNKLQDLDVDDVASEEIEVLQADDVTAFTLVLAANRPALNSSDEDEMAEPDDGDADCVARIDLITGAGRRRW
jgi:hypothetical protein